ncbi:MAG: formyltransferase family protein, partial [Thermodesulfobacteriota bacterium]|nr:formyltransferase family protein [Thermodesulfobacteriota bacterium]
DNKGGSPFKVVGIFSDSWQSKALEIGRNYDLPVVTRDISSFYRKKGKPKKDLSLRIEFDKRTVELIAPFNAHAAALGGYMSIVTQPLIDAFLGINVHPGDLSITKKNGKRKYVGEFAVKDAILAGEKTISSSTHIIEDKVDEGRLLMISRPVKVEMDPRFNLENRKSVEKISEFYQSRLKEHGDWEVFPKTIEYIARGRFKADKKGMIYFDDKAIPYGIRMEEIK